jgi:hypothetical protein
MPWRPLGQLVARVIALRPEDPRSERRSEHDRREPNRLRECAARRLRRQRQVEAIYKLGPRVLLELLTEIDRHNGLGNDLDQRLAKYAEIDPAALTATGGDRFPPLPIREVPP